MHRFAIFQCNNPQMLAQFFNKGPVADTIIFLLSFAVNVIYQCLFAPFSFQIRPFPQYLFFKVSCFILPRL